MISYTLQVTPRDLGYRSASGAPGGRLEAGFIRGWGCRRDRRGGAWGQGTTFERERSPFSSVGDGGMVGREGRRAQKLSTLGRGVNDDSVHLSSPRGGGGAGRRGPALRRPTVLEDGAASGGHRGKLEGAGRARRALPARAWGCPVLQRKCCPGQKGGGRKWAGGSCEGAASEAGGGGSIEGNGTQRPSPRSFPRVLDASACQFFPPYR